MKAGGHLEVNDIEPEEPCLDRFWQLHNGLLGTILDAELYLGPINIGEVLERVHQVISVHEADCAGEGQLAVQTLYTLGEEALDDGRCTQVNDDIVAKVRVSPHSCASMGGVAAPAKARVKPYHILAVALLSARHIDGRVWHPAVSIVSRGIP